jgi:murein DD-endopeptidase MepM/ murein hydrolase activator NlpD
MGFSGSASGQESLKDLQARMDSIQGDLDATTIRIERLRDQNDHLRGEMVVLEQEMQKLEDERRSLMSDAVARADELYRGGTIGMAEALFTSENFSELSTRAELISQVSAQDSGVFVKLSRTQSELNVINEDLAKREAELKRVTAALEETNEELQEQFHSVSAEYQRLRRKLAAAQVPTGPSGNGGGGAAPIKINVSGNMTCPVAGPVSFVDSWGAPRSGHTHQGVDMMGDYGTPLVAIVSGTVTYAAYDGSGGNMLWIAGTDGNSYYYMHNQENFVGEGARVQVGQQIGTLGDTGNAAGTPHLHFEFHPGGGSAVNPYPLVSSLC